MDKIIEKMDDIIHTYEDSALGDAVVMAKIVALLKLVREQIEAGKSL